MNEANATVLNDYPYPVAYPYSLIFQPDERPSIRRWALCFTVYQLLRMVSLPLVSQYLRAPVCTDPAAKTAVAALNKAIAGIRSPFFSDWITLIYTLNEHLPKVGILPLFPGLDGALKALKPTQERPIGTGGQTRLNPLNAILALRNATAHGGMPNEEEAAQHLDVYLPVLHEVLDGFSFLKDVTLKVYVDWPAPILMGEARVRTLRGVSVGDPVKEDLDDAFQAAFGEADAALRGPDGRVVPLYPLSQPVTDREPLFLYDGHYGIRVQTARGAQGSSYIYYLGTYHRTEDPTACDKLRELLKEHEISFALSKEQTAPWTVAQSAADYSRRTLNGLVGTKYFPACYLPVEDLDHHLGAFLKKRPAQEDTSRPRYVNGFVLTGPVGAGKTALLARQVESLLAPPAAERGGLPDDSSWDRDNPNLVLFLRGDGIALRPEGMSLFRDVAEKLGVAVDNATTGKRDRGGFSTFRELLDHLHGRWKQDRAEGRQLILVLDALNEAPLAETIIREALDMVDVAACFPWCKIVLSLRREWLLRLRPEKMGTGEPGKLQPQEIDPLERMRPYLYVREPQGGPSGGRVDRQGPPVVELEPLSEAAAAAIYERYQASSGDAATEERGYRVPACRTLWGEIPAETRDLLKSPLYLHLFMETFDGQVAGAMLNVPTLFRHYADRTLREHSGLNDSLGVVLEYLIRDMTRTSANLTDDDCNALRTKWAAGLSEVEVRLSLSPVEALVCEGLMQKRVGEEGGGYRFTFQAVAEYLLYRYLCDIRPASEDEAAYWTRRSQATSVFAEYRGAFAFLLRDWAAQGRLPLIGPLLEASAPWLDEVVLAFLMEQAQTGYVPGQGSEAGNAAAKALAESGGRRCAGNLLDAGYRVGNSKLAEAGVVYLQAANQLSEVLWAANPEDVGIGVGLGGVLTSLGDLFERSGRPAEAEAAYARAGDIQKAQWMALSLPEALEEAEPADKGDDRLALSPSQLLISIGIAHSLNSQGDLLRKRGRPAEAEVAYTQAIDILESLWEADEADDGIGGELVRALASQGDLFQRNGRPAEAEVAYTRALGISEALWAGNPQDVSLGSGLAGLLLSRGVLFHHTGRPVEAEATYTRAVEMNEALWSVRPEDVRIGGRLAMTLNNLGGLLAVGGRQAEAEVAFTRAIDVYEALWMANPQDVEIKIGYANTLAAVGRTDEAEPLINEVLAQMPRHPLANEIKRRYFSESEESEPSNSGLATILAVGGIALGALFAVLKHRGKKDE